jgi:hypothetical protein
MRVFGLTCVPREVPGSPTKTEVFRSIEEAREWVDPDGGRLLLESAAEVLIRVIDGIPYVIPERGRLLQLEER